MTAKVSIIIPVYNAEKYLRKCLESVVGQTLEDIEIICIDDGSTDDSWAILQDIAKVDDRVIIIQQENSGAAVARNKGLDAASGEYVGFVDSDDYVDNTYFEELYRAAKKQGADISRAYVKVDSGREDSAVGRFNLNNHDAYEHQYNVYIKDIIARNKLNQRFSIWLAIFKRSMLAANDIVFPPHIRTGQDILFNIKTGYFANKIVYVENPVYYHRIMRDGSLMTEFAYTVEGLSSRLSVIQENLKFLNSKPDYDEDIYVSHVFDSFNFIHTKLSTIKSREFAEKVANSLSESWRNVKYRERLREVMAREYRDFSEVIDNKDSLLRYIHNTSISLSGVGVSVVMPAYNAGTYIAEAIAGLKGQSFKRFECIIVDDGSTDDTVNIVENKIRGDERFRLVKQSNQGVSVARNRGLKEAAGEYVIFLDADDIFDPQLLKELYENARNNSTDISICGYNVLDSSDGSVGRNIKTPFVERLPKGVFSSKDVDFIFNFAVLTVWNKLFRREFIIENDLTFDKDIRRSQDLLFVGSALAVAQRITYIDIPLITYRDANENSNMGQANKYPRSFIDSLDLLKDFLKRKGMLRKLSKSYDNLLVGSSLSYLELYEDDDSIIDGVLNEVAERFRERKLTTRDRTYFSMPDKYETVLAASSGKIMEYMHARLIWQKDYSKQLTRRLNATEDRRIQEEQRHINEMTNLQNEYNPGIKASLRMLRKGVKSKIKKLSRER